VSAATLQAILQVRRVIDRVLAAPGAHGGLTEAYIEELEPALAEYIGARFQGQFSVHDRRDMARFVIIHHQAQRHAACAAVDVRAQDDPLLEALVKGATNHALEVWDRRQRGDARSCCSRSAKDRELVSGLFHEADRDAVIICLRDLHRSRLFDHSKVIQCYFDLAEELGREPHLEEAADRARVCLEIAETAVLLFKDMLSGVADDSPS
jgi:hypothetical protein